MDSSRTIEESVNKQPRIEDSNVTIGLGNQRASPSRQKGPQPSASSVIQKRSLNCYQGAFGNFRIDKRTRDRNVLPCARAFDQKISLEETSIAIAPKLVRRRFELLRKIQFGQISRTLNVYPVMAWASSLFQMCRSGDIHGLQAAFGDGGVTPFVLDEHGFTTLHVCHTDRQT